MKLALTSKLHALPRMVLAGSIASMVLAGSALGADVIWNGAPQSLNSSGGGDDVTLESSTVVTLGAPGTTVSEKSIFNDSSGMPGSTTLTLNSADATSRTLVSGLTVLAGGNGQSLVITGSANFRTGFLADGGFSNVQLVKNGGTGELILDGIANDLDGALLRVVDGTVSVEGGGGTDSPISTLLQAIRIDGATAKLRLGTPSGASTTFNNSLLVNFSGTLEHTAASNDTLTGGVTIDNSATLNANVSAGSLTLSGNIFGNGGLSKAGAATLVLSGTNTYAGATTIGVSGGILQFAKVAALYTNTPASWIKTNITVNSGATLAFNVGGSGEFTASDIGTLLGNLTVAINNNGFRAGSRIGFDTTYAAGGNFTIVNTIADSTGTGSGTLGVTKLGTNGLTLGGANTYTGGTTVSAGTLALGSGGSLGNTAISVSGTATFAARPGSGSVSAGTTGAGTAGATLTLNAGSAFSMVDNAIGIFNLRQNVSFASAGLVSGVASGAAPTLTFDLGGSSIDVVNVTKGVTPGTVPGVVNFQALTGLTSITLGDYTFITAANGLGPSAFTLGSTTITVGANTYTLSLSHSTATVEYLTVAAAANNNASQILITSSPDSITTGGNNNSGTSTTHAFGRVLLGSVQTTVSETVTKTGTDTTTYTVVSAGDVSTTTFASGGFAGGTVPATGTITLDTAVAGSKSGTVTIHNSATTSASVGLGSNDSDDVFTVTGTVVAGRTFTNPATITLGRVLLGSAVPAGQSGSVTSTASRATTADATLASYGGSALNGLTLSGGNVLFNGTTTSATYTLSGTVSGTAGSAVGGTFGLNATDEFSNVLTNAAGVTFSGTGINGRTFSSPAQHDFGRVLLGTALSSGNLGITTGGSNATTADATLAAYGGSAVNGLTATGAATLADGTVPTINRVISGTLSGTAGTLTGTFQMGATDEFSNVTANAANVSYTVSGLATRTVTAPASTALGTYHAGAPVNVTSNPFGFSYGSGGTGDHADTEDTTVQTYTGGADANGITLTGAANNITTGVAFTRRFTGTAAVNSSGGSFNPAVNPEFSAATTVTAAYTIGVYSGNMKWSGISGGNWNNDSNWTDSVAGGIQAAPGRDVSYLNTDGANFGATSGAVTVHLNVSSSLKTVAFDGTGTYTVDSTVGTLTLKSGSGDASISVTGSGTQTISAPIVLANVGNTQVSVAANGTLNLGAISDTATTTLVKTGAGVLNLDGALTIDTLKTTGGVTNLNSAFTGGILNANATTNITVSEDLLELNIGTVPLAPVANLGGDSGTATSTVPEPGALGMLLVGGLGILGTRRRR